MNKQQIAKKVESNENSESPFKVGPAPSKKKKKNDKTPVYKICAQARIEQYLDDLCRRKYIILQILSP